MEHNTDDEETNSVASFDGRVGQIPMIPKFDQIIQNIVYNERSI